MSNEKIKSKAQGLDFENPFFKSLSYYSIPVVDKIGRDFFELSGTANFFQKGDRVYLISAAHVFDSCKAAGILLDKIIIGLSGKVEKIKLNFPDETKSFNLDLAIAPLPQNEVKETEYYSYFRSLVKYEELIFSPTSSYFLNGYIASKSRFHTMTNSFSSHKLVHQVTSISQLISKDGIAQFKTPIHSDEEKREKLPKLQGLSGCPLLQVHTYPDGVSRMSIAGICVSYSLTSDRQNYLIDVYTTQLLNFLFSNYPGE
ncbi:hypothetical protein EHQ61_00790 [Leptospira wolffii]|uniref:hypothetical protein n=1 Tax=Leptospira wolffii TaxID=409998 RepID=UPI001082B0A6|nr:hypothetical protein [Leptospira wolffii]TGL55279.1 hypothetical protein EHQ61_00790 [Leptospira wolffii]